jgi:hypothetical protein
MIKLVRIKHSSLLVAAVSVKGKKSFVKLPFNERKIPGRERGANKLSYLQPQITISQEKKKFLMIKMFMTSVISVVAPFIPLCCSCPS